MLIDANGIFKIKNSLGWQMKNGAKYEYTYEQIECENVAYERRRHVPSVSFWTTTAAACHRGSNSHKNGCYSNLRSIKYFNLMPSVSGAWVSHTCDSTLKKRTHGIKRWKKNVRILYRLVVFFFALTLCPQWGVEVCALSRLQSSIVDIFTLGILEGWVFFIFHCSSTAIQCFAMEFIALGTFLAAAEAVVVVVAHFLIE